MEKKNSLFSHIIPKIPCQEDRDQFFIVEQGEYERAQAQHEAREVLPGYIEELFPI